MPLEKRPAQGRVMRYLRLLFLPLLAFVLLGASGCASRSKKSEQTQRAARFLLEAGPRDAGALVRLPVSQVSIAVEPKSHFSEYDIEKCEAVDLELGKALAFRLTAEAGRDLYRLSVQNQGKRLVTTINGRAVGARLIDGPLAQNYIVTYVELPEEDLVEVAHDIERTSGDLRAELEKQK